jgi:hypothetical protein
MKTETTNIAWCRDLFALLNEGGEWGVPRSGLVFTKRGPKLVLTKVLPYTPELEEGYKEGLDVPANAEDLLDYQRRDYEVISSYFLDAGILVESEVKLYDDDTERE